MRELVIIVAEYLIILSILGTLAVLLLLNNKDKKTFILRLIIGGIIALLIAYIARKLYYNPRPFVAEHFTPYFSHSADNGFVSDHTLLASFLAFTCYFYRRWVGAALLVLAIGIGAARVAAGVHHWLDIVSAIVVSLIAAVAAYLITKEMRKLRQKS